MNTTVYQITKDRPSSFVKIPEVIKDWITSFPMPESMKGRDDAYGGLVYAQLSDAGPRFYDR